MNPGMFDGLSGNPDLCVWAPGEWALVNPLSYESLTGRVYPLPSGFISDLASIPKPARALFDTDDEIRIPALFHDFHYCSQMPKDEADALFREMMERAGLYKPKVLTVYAAVRVGGWYRYRQCRTGPKSEDFAWARMTLHERLEVQAQWPSVLAA